MQAFMVTVLGIGFALGASAAYFVAVAQEAPVIEKPAAQVQEPITEPTYHLKFKNEKFKGSADEVDNLTYLYGRLDYMTYQMNLLLDTCAK